MLWFKSILSNEGDLDSLLDFIKCRNPLTNLHLILVNAIFWTTKHDPDRAKK